MGEPGGALQPSPSSLNSKPERVVETLSRLEKELGGRLALVRALSLAPPSGERDYLIGMLGDPAYDHLSLSTLCDQANLPIGDLLQLYRQAMLAVGQARSARIIGREVEGTVKDVMRRSAPYGEPCERCRGTGSVTPEPTEDTPNPAPQPCHVCQGKGERPCLPDLDRQKVALELAGLISRKGPQTFITQQQQVLAPTLPSLLTVQQETESVLYGEGQVVEPEAPEEGEDGQPAL